MNYQENLKEVLSLANNQQFAEALSKLVLLKQDKVNLVHTLRLMVKIAVADKNYDLAKKELAILMRGSPNNFEYLSVLTDIYLGENDINAVCAQYITFIEKNPNHAVAIFNGAYYCKKMGQFEKALNFYEKAIALHIEHPHEVYINMATILTDHFRDDNKAENYLNKAIALKPNDSAALYNLANLYEQQGNKDKACDYFERSYLSDKNNTDALARLIDIKNITSEQDPIIETIKAVLHTKKITKEKRCNLFYGLGKGFDQCKNYAQAFAYYQQANKLDKQTLPPYDAKLNSRYIDVIIAAYRLKQKNLAELKTDISPIFICGMFRSGSTLLEQILAAHSKITAGGELDFFQRLVTHKKGEFPTNFENLCLNEKEQITQNYQTEIHQSFPNAQLITDKRPDNLYYLGLIKQIFPRAKIIVTQRYILDNCLSIYFLRLGAAMNYATDLSNIIHAYKEQQRLIEHWQALFEKDIFMFNYDHFIQEPETEIRHLLRFLDLSWDDACLNFHHVKNTVKTASVWQVRQPLYQHSSGRWQNYAQQLKALDIRPT